VGTDRAARWLTGLAVSEHDVFVADSGNRVVLRYDRAGQLLRRIGERNSQSDTPGIIMPSPFLCVVRREDGLLAINNTGRHRVEIYTADGELKAAWGTPSFAVEGFCGCCNPIAIALTPEGHYVTCEKGLPRVKLYDPQGVLKCVVAGPESFAANRRLNAGAGRADPTLAALDAVVDRRGHIYILDRAANDIREMAPKVSPKTA